VRRITPCRLGFWITCGLFLTIGVPGMVTYRLDEALLAMLIGVVREGDDWEGVEEIATGALYMCKGLPAGIGAPCS